MSVLDELGAYQPFLGLRGCAAGVGSAWPPGATVSLQRCPPTLDARPCYAIVQFERVPLQDGRFPCRGLGFIADYRSSSTCLLTTQLFR